MSVENDKIRVFTREEFYDFVWSAPATKLAVELGCSDVMVGKVCRSYDIPKPYPGYWAQLAHGKQPKRTVLPRNDQKDLQSLSFYKYPEFETTINEPPRETRFDSDILSILIKAKQLGKVKVAKSLRDPHSLIVATKEQHERNKANLRLSWDERVYEPASEKKLTLALSASDKLYGRALRIMDALIKRIEKVGGKLEVRQCRYHGHKSETVIAIAGETVTQIRLREKHNQIKITNENAKYSWDRNRTELVPSGLLLIDKGPSSYGSPLLKDKKNFKIEDGLTGLVIRLITDAGEMRICRHEREEKKRQEAIETKLQQEQEERLLLAKANLQKRQDEEQMRLDELIRHANNWRESQLIREYLVALRESLPANIQIRNYDKPAIKNSQESIVRYIEWGLEQADRLDPFSESPYSVLDETLADNDVRVQIRKPR